MEQLWETAKIDILRYKRLEGIDFSIKCEISIRIGFENWYILRGSLCISSGSSAIPSTLRIRMVQWRHSIIGVGLSLNV